MILSKNIAQDAYRRAWLSFCLCTEQKLRYGQATVLDALRLDCARRDGPEWDIFVSSLPGYREYCARIPRAAVGA